MTTLLLAAIGRTRVEAGVALAANHFVAIVFLRENTQGWLDYTTTKTEHEMKSGFCNARNTNN